MHYGGVNFIDTYFRSVLNLPACTLPHGTFRIAFTTLRSKTIEQEGAIQNRQVPVCVGYGRCRHHRRVAI